MDKLIEGMIPIFAIIFTFGIPGIIIFWVFYAKHRERMRLIDKGLTPDEVKNYFKAEFKERDKRPRNPYGALKWGILLLFLGIGFVAAKVLEQKFDFDDGITFGVVLLFIGAGFLTYYLIVRGRIDSGNDDGTKISNN
jgi:hypothetical protein